MSDREPSIAIVGASTDRSKFGNKCVRAYQQAGYRVFPVNPRAEKIEGLPVFRSLQDLPEEPDRISIYLPPEATATLIPELTRYEGAQVWFNPGSAIESTVETARQAGLDVHDGCSIVAIGLSPGQFP